MEKFNKIFSDIKRLNKTDPASDAERLGKLTEEVGELAKEVNKTNGRKVLKPGDTPESIRNEIRDEAADTIQNVISLVDGFGIKPNELLDAIIRKNRSWQEKIKSKKRGPDAKSALDKTKAEPVVAQKAKKKHEQKGK